jgi:predicted Fe-Mo cluster-binding NifX family protein
MVVCIPVTVEGQVGGGWGRADRVAVADVRDGSIASWEEFEVGWGRLHDEEAEGSHHARIARFLTDHGVNQVVAGHMGPPMAQMLGRMGLTVRLGATGNARRAVTSDQS